MTRHRPAQAGFTLVEMLVAMTVFALLAAAGVGVLRSSVDTQAAVDTRLNATSAVGRLQAMLASDLGQAVDRPTRAPGGDRPAFIGEAQAMTFVRSGWQNLDGEPRPDLQRVEWRLDSGSLARVGHARLDGVDDGEPALVARSVDSLALRYRSAHGDWSSVWQAAPDEPLPAAVELTLGIAGGPPLQIIVALPSAVRSPVA